MRFNSIEKRWRILCLGVAAQAVFSASISGIPVAGVVLRSEYQFSNAWVGIIIGCIYLGIASSEIPWGILTDKFGEKIVLAIGLFSTGFLLVSLCLLSSRGEGGGPLLAIGMLLLGVLGGSINGSSGKAVMGWFDAGERGLAMSIRQTAMPVGGALGASVVPLIGINWSMRYAFLFLGVLTLIVAAACFFWVEEPVRSSHNDIFPPKAENPLLNKRVWNIAVASMLLTVPQFVILSFASIFLVDVFQTKVFIASLVLVIVQVFGGALRIYSGRITDKGLSRITVLQVLAMSSALFLVLLGFFAGTTLGVAAIVLVVLSGIAANAWHGVAYTEVASVIPSRAGTALGLENTAVFLMGFIAPVIVPVVLRSSNWSIVWILTSAACAISLVLFTFLKGKKCTLKAK